MTSSECQFVCLPEPPSHRAPYLSCQPGCPGCQPEPTVRTQDNVLVTEAEVSSMACVRKGAPKAKNHIDVGLKTVQAKSWAQPLGQALEGTSKLVEGLGSFLPAEGAIGGAMSFGATLLNPQMSPEDLKKEMQQIKQLLLVIHSQGARQALVKLQDEMENKIRNPPEEIRGDFDEVWEDMKDVHKQVGEFNQAMARDMIRMREELRKTILVVTDIKFKVRGDRQHSYGIKEAWTVKLIKTVERVKLVHGTKTTKILEIMALGQ